MINNEITVEKIRLIDGENNNILTTKEALEMAEERGLDLICISNKGEIPICKIGDYSKYLYEQKKKEKENKKKQKIIETKEIKISESTESNDLKTKAKMIDKFLKNGNKVKLSIKYRGRAARFVEEGPEKLSLLTDLVTENFCVDTPCKIAGNMAFITIAPKK